jgi:hypothetical protein
LILFPLLRYSYLQGDCEQQNILCRNITEARELPSERRRRRRRSKEDIFSSKYLVDDVPLFLLRCEDVTTVS